jgi:hypothetical protein
MMKKIFREYGLGKNGLLAGGLAVFLVLCAILGSGTISDLVDSADFVSIHQLGGREAFAGEQEAFVDSFLTDDTLIVEDATAEPGDSFWLAVSISNNTIEVGGFKFLLNYDTSLIYPDWEKTDPCYPDTPCTIYTVTSYKASRTEDLTYYVWGSTANHFHIDTLRFAAVMNIGHIPTPHLPIGGSGPVVWFKFWVKPHADPGAETDIQFLFWDEDEGNYASTLSDTLGVHNYIPETKPGVFTVKDTSGPPENHYPAVYLTPSQSSFQVYEGVTLEFDVTATDEDGDTIHLYMDPLDMGSLNYSFPETTGVGSVTQKFEYTPGFDEGGITRYVSFKAEDEHGLLTTKTVTIEILETVQDVLMASSLQGGIPGSKDRMVPFLITNSVDIYGFQFTFRWDPTRLWVDSIAGTEAIEGFSIWHNLNDSVAAGNATVLVFGLSGETIPAGLDTVIYPAFRVFPEAEPGEVDILIENAREAINPGYPSQPLGTVNGKFIIDMYGDANLDQLVDVGDVVDLVHYILGLLAFDTRKEMTADVNQDSLINVADLVAMIDIIMGRWTGPSAPMYNAPMAKVTLDYDDLLKGSSGEMMVMADLKVPVAGAQLEINYDPAEVSFQVPRLSEMADHFITEFRDDGNGRLILLLYNWSNDPIPVGEGSIISLPATIKPYAPEDLRIELKEVILADQKAAMIPVGDLSPSVPAAFELSQNYPNPFNPSTTIKFTLPSLTDGGMTLSTTLKVYNVLGEVVRTLVDEPMAPGTHHVMWDGKDDRGNQVASGIYFYRLRSGDFQDTKKMVMMK